MQSIIFLNHYRSNERHIQGTPYHFFAYNLFATIHRAEILHEFVRI